MQMEQLVDFMTSSVVSKSKDDYDEEEFDDYQSGNALVSNSENANIVLSQVIGSQFMLSPPPKLPPPPKRTQRKHPSPFNVIEPIPADRFENDETIETFCILYGHYIGYITNIKRFDKKTNIPSIRGSIHIGLRHEVVCHPEIKNSTIRVTAFQEVIRKNGPIIYTHDIDHNNPRFIYCTTWKNHEFMLSVSTIQVRDRAVTEHELEIILELKYPLPAECQKCHNPLQLY